jgi:branched-chain amino acid transport system permease protein
VSDFLQFGFQGLALGAIYALVALGFVIIYKATEVINFAHGELMLLGAYLVYAFHNEVDINYYLAVPLAIVAMAMVGWIIERLILRRMVGKPVFAVVMITIGLSIVLHQIVTARWGFADRQMRDPWIAKTVDVGNIRITTGSVVTIVVAAAVLMLFFAFFRYSKYGVAMRATAFDQEAALAVGIPVRRVYALSWMIAAAIAALGGTFISSFPSSLNPNLGFAALRAFPAAILGGLDSPGGAVLGGFIIGEVEVLTQAYQPDVAPWLGNNFHVVAAYAIMILVLMVRPYGLFGTPQVERV